MEGADKEVGRLAHILYRRWKQHIKGYFQSGHTQRLPNLEDAALMAIHSTKLWFTEIWNEL